MTVHEPRLIIRRCTLILKDTHGIIDDLTGEALMEMSDALFEAGCDDCSPGKSCGIITVGFDREADSLEAAIRSAIADVHSAGYSVNRVKVNPPPFVEEINAQLAEGSAVSH